MTTNDTIEKAFTEDNADLLKQIDIYFGADMTTRAVRKKANNCLQWLLNEGVPLALGCYSAAIQAGNEDFVREHADDFPDGSLTEAYNIDNPVIFATILRCATDDDISAFIKVAMADNLRPQKRASYLAVVNACRPQTSSRLTRAIVVRAIKKGVLLPLRDIGFSYCVLPRGASERAVAYYRQRLRFQRACFRHPYGRTH